MLKSTEHSANAISVLIYSNLKTSNAYMLLLMEYFLSIQYNGCKNSFIYVYYRG